MIDITPLTEKEISQAAKAYFAAEFQTRQMGTAGLWFGEGANGLNLGVSAAPEQFHNLACGLTPDGKAQALSENGNSKEPVAWQIKFQGTQNLSVLWALAPENSRRAIEAAHCTAVSESFREFEKLFTKPGEEKVGLVSVVFFSGTTWDQCPYRLATAFLFKQALVGKTSPHKYVGIEIEHCKQELKWHYEGAMDYFLWKAIGSFHRVPGCDDLRIDGVPPKLVQSFFYGPSFGVQAKVCDGEPVSDKALFEEWQTRAEQWGWGPEQAKKLLELCRLERELEEIKHRVLDNLRRSKASLEHARNTVTRALGFDRRNEASLDQVKEHDRDRSR